MFLWIIPGIIMENAILDMDLLHDQQNVPIDPAPIIYQMRKPQLKKKKVIYYFYSTIWIIDYYKLYFHYG